MDKSDLAGSAHDGGLVENALLLGIDMGTSRSSIVSMRGARKTAESYVGWPRDAVSRKLFATDVVYGRGALDNRLALDLYRPLEHGVIKGADAKAGPERERNLTKTSPAHFRVGSHVAQYSDTNHDAGDTKQEYSHGLDDVRNAHQNRTNNQPLPTRRQPVTNQRVRRTQKCKRERNLRQRKVAIRKHLQTQRAEHARDKRYGFPRTHTKRQWVEGGLQSESHQKLI